MKKSNEYINKAVFNANLKYVKLQNKTKEMFFNCLDEGRSVEYFRDKIENLWGTLDHSFLEEQILEYEEIVHKENLKSLEIEKDIPLSVSLFIGLFGLSKFLRQEERFINIKKKEYENAFNSKAYKNDKAEYLKLKVKRYNNQTVPYYFKEGNRKPRYVQLSTYEAMIHNTNLTRAGWNTTLSDGEALGRNLFVIPYHSFSCPHCVAHQNRVMTIDEVLAIGLEAEEREGDLLHPNCKCILSMDMSLLESPFNRQYTDIEKEMFYEIRQKTNSLTLKKEQLLSDIKIQKSLGNFDEVDKLNQQRNKINSQIRDLKEQLPTEELQKQVVAINR